MGKTTKKSYDEVYEFFKSKGLELLDKEYIGAYNNMNCIDIYGYKLVTDYNCLQQDKNPNRFGRRNFYTIENICNYIKLNRNYVELISTVYTNATEKLIFRCLVHNEEFKMSWCNFKSGHGCPKCAIENKAKKRRLTIDEIIYRFKQINRENIELVSDEYTHSHKKLIFKCLIHKKEFAMTWGDFLKGVGCSICGTKRTVEKISGKNHVNYKHSKTDEERELERKYPEYRKFIRDSLELANYTCDITGIRGCKLEVHHLDGYNWFVEGRTDVNNAVVLSEEMHHEFHHKDNYGKGNNTKEQYIKFKEMKLKELNKVT